MKKLFRVVIYTLLASVVMYTVISGYYKRPSNDVSTLNQSLYSMFPQRVVNRKRPPCILGSIPLKRFKLYNSTRLPNVTVVTAYFDLGRFKKGDTFFDTGLYRKWAHVYKYLQNPLVFYTDSEQIVELMKTITKGKENITKINLIKRSSLWAFDYVETIRKIYSNPQYPKHHPNTVVPEYSCSQHAKYAVVEDAVKINEFHTNYFTWLDLGYFRYLLHRHKNFVITVPPMFNESQVAMNLVARGNMKTSPHDIVFMNKIWIGGGMFFGTVNTLPTFIEDYRLAVEHYLSQNLSSTDQQVLYSMNTDAERKVVTQRVQIHKYQADVAGDCWFYLGYACYKELP